MIAYIRAEKFNTTQRCEKSLAIKQRLMPFHNSYAKEVLPTDSGREGGRESRLELGKFVLHHEIYCAIVCLT